MFKEEKNQSMKKLARNGTRANSLLGSRQFDQNRYKSPIQISKNAAINSNPQSNHRYATMETKEDLKLPALRAASL